VFLLKYISKKVNFLDIKHFKTKHFSTNILKRDNYGCKRLRRENWELDSFCNIFIRNSNVNAAPTTQQQQKVKHTWRNIVEQNEQN